MARRRLLIAAFVTALALGVGALVLQRWVAQTFQLAVALVVAWFAIVTVAALFYSRGRPDIRAAALATIAAVGVVSAGGGYWTGVRKDEVNEQVVIASARAGGEARTTALAGMGSTGVAPGTDRAVDSRPEAVESEPRGPVELASGGLAGADGHAGQGTATVVDEDGERTLTLTDFDVDAGPDVNIYLSETTEGIEGAIDLGDLKAERGNQVYEIPADADLTRFDNLVLYCIPFTTRIATAELR